ncbi:MAG: InlB B-repeat-containing protein, partial [Christensenella sp.]|nr:InlB B-repeat-containing protein [Christensenella sp.]
APATGTAINAFFGETMPLTLTPSTGNPIYAPSVYAYDETYRYFQSDALAPELIVTGGTYGTDYSYDLSNGVLTILTGTAMTISMATPGATTADTIIVSSGVNASLTLSDVSIDASGTSDACAFRIADNSGGNVNITLSGDNTLISGANCAGLQKNGTAGVGTLAIGGTGTLTARGGTGGAGIGGGSGSTAYALSIGGGTVFATGGSGAQDIGAGAAGSGGSLSISGNAAVFLKNDSSVTPTTINHSHLNLNNTTTGDIQHGVSVPWSGDFGAWLWLVTLSYDANGGIGGTTPGSVTQQANTSATVASSGGYTKDGYSQVAWNTQSDGAGSSYAYNSSFTMTADTVLYAEWSDAPVISAQPSDKTAVVGKTASFSVKAVGAAPFSYRWQIDRGSGWSDISGATGASYTTAAVALSNDGYRYRSIVSNATGSATSDPATLHVIEQAVIPTTRDAAQPWLWFGSGILALAGLTIIVVILIKRRAPRL